MTYSKKNQKKLESQNKIKRKNRAELVKFALVGYTNAGKSTLMKALTQAEVYIKNELFATLDTTTRGFELPSGMQCLLSDTVGFIRKLPTHLIASFRSTLAEVLEADYLVHVVDLSNSEFEDQLQVVEQTLKSIKADHIPLITVFNKIDLLPNLEEIKYIQDKYPLSCFVSAKNNQNIIHLLKFFEETYEKNSNQFELLLPWQDMKLSANLFKFTSVVEQVDNELGTKFKVKVNNENLDYFNNIYNKYFN